MAISAASELAVDWKSGVESGLRSALSNMILAFANSICIRLLSFGG